MSVEFVMTASNQVIIIIAINKCSCAVHSDAVVTVHDRNNDSIYLCSACWASSTDYSACESCGEIHHVSNLIDGYCPDCVSEDTDVAQ